MARMARRVLTRQEMDDVADQLRNIVAAVDSGDLTAPRDLVVRLEGAILALDELRGDKPI